MNEFAVTTRLATVADDAFLKDLFFQVRSPEFLPANLPDEQLRSLMIQQFEAMRVHYCRVFPEMSQRILELGGQPIGYEAIRESDEIHLIDISVMPEYQNRGVGTSRMRTILQRAERSGKSVILSVEVFNPARRLYERLGFEEYEDFGMYKRMRWKVPCMP